MRTRFTCLPLFAPLALAARGLAYGPTDTLGQLGNDCAIDDDCAADLRCSFGECTTETGGCSGAGGCSRREGGRNDKGDGACGGLAIESEHQGAVAAFGRGRHRRKAGRVPAIPPSANVPHGLTLIPW